MRRARAHVGADITDAELDERMRFLFAAFLHDLANKMATPRDTLPPARAYVGTDIDEGGSACRSDEGEIESLARTTTHPANDHGESSSFSEVAKDHIRKLRAKAKRSR